MEKTKRYGRMRLRGNREAYGTIETNLVSSYLVVDSPDSGWYLVNHTLEEITEGEFFLHQLEKQ